MKNSITFQNGHNKARFSGRLGKTIVEEKEVEKVVGDEDKQDNALKASKSFFSSPMLARRLYHTNISWEILLKDLNDAINLVKNDYKTTVDTVIEGIKNNLK